MYYSYFGAIVVCFLMKEGGLDWTANPGFYFGNVQAL